MKYCTNCAAQLDDNAAFCTQCGTKLEPVKTPDNEKSENTQNLRSEEAQETKQNTVPHATAPQNAAPRYSVQQSVPTCTAPRIQLATNRGLAKMIFLSLITLGIYGIVIWSRIADEINIAASRYDGRKTMPYFAMCTVCPLTFGILYYVWIHNFCDRVGTEVKRRGYNYSFGAADFWLWNVLGSLIIVGPFIFLYKLMKSMNMINASYNING